MPDRPDSAPARRRWLLLIQQLPTRPSSARIKTWRRLQQIGSVVLKNSVYVLPHTPQAREDFEWLATEIRAANGQASVMAAEALTAAQETDICEAFRAARSFDYEHVRRHAQELARRVPANLAAADRQTVQRALSGLRGELARIQAIDFCGAPARTAAEEALETLTSRLTKSATAPAPVSAGPPLSREQFQRRIWVTRLRPGVDRMASAWLILRFIDPAAQFRFTHADVKAVPKRQVPFDMYDAEFGHHGERCTFETLCERFGIDDAAARHIGTIVHDIDLKEERYNPPERPVVASLVQGLQASYPNDDELLQHGMALFAGLYQSLTNTTRAAKPAARKAPKSKPKPRHRR